MNLAQQQRILTDVKIQLEELLYDAFIDIPQAMGGNINEIHDTILSTLLTEIAKAHHKFYVDEEED